MEKKVGCEKSGTTNVPAKAAKRTFKRVQIDVDDSIPKSKRKKKLPSSAYNTRLSLHSAVEEEDIQLIQYLLSKGTSVNVADEFQRTVLHMAAFNGNAEIVKLLLDYKADVTVRDIGTRFPLHYAAESGNLEIIKLLLKAPTVNGRSAGINVKTRYNETPLHIIAFKGHTHLVNHMIGLGADITAQTSTRGSTPLEYAAAAGNAKTVKELLLYGAKILPNNAPLYSAIHDDWEFGADFGRKLSQSRILKQLEVIDALLEAGANVNNDQYITPLSYAVFRGIEDIVKKLLDCGAEVDATNRADSGMTVPNICKILIDTGANRSVNGMTALQYAAQDHDSPNICKLLIDAGADINRRDDAGFIAIHYAVMWHKKEITSTLLAAGSDINTKDRRENGLFLLSGMWNTPDWELLNILLESGLDFNTRHPDGQNAFYYLFWAKHKNLLAILIDYNPDLNNICERGLTPLKCYSDIYREKLKKLTKFFIMTMVKMECSSAFKINDMNMEVIKKFYFNFYEQCKKEVKNMKSKKVWKHISFFDLLNKPLRKLVDYCKNEELINYLDSGDYKQFENYSCIIELRMSVAMNKHLLLEKSVKMLKRLIKPITLPYFVRLRILGNLNSYDLESVSSCKYYK